MKKIFSAVLLAVAAVPVPGAEATTMVSTKLADIAGFSRAVVQGEVIATTNLIDQTEKGRPWTIYTMLVERVLAGEVADTEFSFRCLGGTYADGTFLELVGAPRPAVGDSIVAFIGAHPTCQFAGREFGVFWLKEDRDGIERLVDIRGRVLGALSANDVMFSADVIGEGADLIGFPKSQPPSSEELGEVAEGDLALRPPAASADEILDELGAFSAAYLTNTKPLASTADLKGIQDFTPVPPAADEETQ